jgi:hypothetical protein
MVGEMLDTGRDLGQQERTGEGRRETGAGNQGQSAPSLTVPRLPSQGVAPVRRLEPRLLRTIFGNAPNRHASVAVTRCSERYTDE